MKKLPPVEKIYEAYSALADGRVTMSKDSQTALVLSSSKTKKYTVSWDDDNYSSNDNASYWQGYPGYPIIAVLMLQGRVSYDKDIAKLFAHINWTALNQKFKNDYTKAVNFIIKEHNYDSESIKAAVNQVFDELKASTIYVKRSSLRPPKK